MRFNLPKDVMYIIDKIYENRYEAYIVGGCVRDILLGSEPNDYDITTNATPDEIINIFKDYKIIPTGIQHGTVTLVLNNENYEITTYRIDGDYLDSRRPNQVTYTKRIIEDLQRRDFTINSMAYNHIDGLVDWFNGVDDLHKKIISCVGNPDKRFIEDALRILRAIRFSAKLGFEIEKNTLDSIYRNSYLINKVSMERIQEELNKTILSDNAEYIKLIHNANIYKFIDININNVNLDELNLINNCKKDIKMRITLYFYILKVNKNECEDILKKLKYSNYIIKEVTLLLEHLNLELNDNKISLKNLLKNINKERFNNLLYLRLIIAQYYKDIEKIHQLQQMKLNLEEIYKNNEVYLLKDLKIKGSDLKIIGYNGIDIGNMLEKLLDLVIKNPYLNKKEILENIALHNIDND